MQFKYTVKWAELIPPEALLCLTSAISILLLQDHQYLSHINETYCAENSEKWWQNIHNTLDIESVSRLWWLRPGLQWLLYCLLANALQSIDSLVILHVDIICKQEPKSIFHERHFGKFANLRPGKISVDFSWGSKNNISKQSTHKIIMYCVTNNVSPYMSQWR